MFWEYRLASAITWGIVGAILGFIIGIVWAFLSMDLGVFNWEIVRNCTVASAIIVAIWAAATAEEELGKK